jgi:hypothetical protein
MGEMGEMRNWDTVGKSEVKYHLEDLNADDNLLLKRTLKELCWKGWRLVNLALDRHQWHTFVMTVADLQVP